MPSPIFNIGAAPNDGTGDPIRTAFQKVNRLPLPDSTINAGSGDYLGTSEAKITLAIADAVAQGKKFVSIPQSMLPYTASLVTYNTGVRLIAEGYDPSVFNVRAYGAKGDGIASETIALQAAINGAAAAGGSGTVFFPSGVYLNTAQLTLLSNITLAGEGRESQILQTNQAIQNCMLGSNVNGIQIHGLFFNGPGTNHTDVNTTACIRIDTVGSNNVKIFNCDIEKFDDGMLLNDVTEIQVWGCRFKSNSGNAGLLQGCINGTFSGCDWNGDRTGIGDGLKGQSILALAESVSVPGTFSSRIAVTGNSTRHCGNDAIFCQGNHCTISGNVLDDVNNGVTLQAGFNENTPGSAVGGSFNTVTGNVMINVNNNGVVIQPSPTKTASAHHNNVTGNTIDGGLIGIALSADAYENIIADNIVNAMTSHGIIFNPGATASRNSITGNTVIGVGATGIQLRGTGNGNRVTNNLIRLAHDDGFRQVEAAVDTLIAYNTIIDSDSASIGFRFGINVSAGTRTVVRGNKCFVTNTANFQTFGINIAAACTDTEVVNNDCRNNKTTTNGLQDQGSTRPYFRGNQRVAGGQLKGTVTLAAANPAATVSTTEVLAGDTIILMRGAAGGTLGHLSIGTITANTSFTIVASGNADTSTVTWEIVH